MKYIFSYSNPNQHFIDIEFVADNINSSETLVQLPAWRPGRYELGNFAKNIQRWAAYDESGKALAFSKIKKDCWKVETKGIKELHIKYNYYAAEINAGSSYLDETQLYVNPVNCCVYIPERINEACEIELKISADYKVATAMQMAKGKSSSYATKDFHELADSPFIASNSLQQTMFVLDGVEFHLWFQGECKPDMSKLVNDFFIFISEQFLMMKELPSDAYHFFFQILPYKFYHGVEHLNSTVIALGPSYNLMKGDLYDDLLGVSSHELFHAWNIKSIRPAEMQPYDYTKENYSRLGYVCEGVTTYYGDLFLFRSGVFNEFEYLKTVHERLQKHFDNYGRYNLSVADSSFDTWLDGYVAGVPNRKTSIYDEGSILAFITDMFIRKHSDNNYSLDDVMRYLYFEFGKKQKGYSEADYKSIVEKMAGQSMDELWNYYIHSAVSYETPLMEALEFIGLEFNRLPAKKSYERYFGFKTTQTPLSIYRGVEVVSAVHPLSVAYQAGLAVNDEIISVNGILLKSDLEQWSKYFGKSELKFLVSTLGNTREIILNPSHDEYFPIYYLEKKPKATEAQKKAYQLWSKARF